MVDQFETRNPDDQVDGGDKGKGRDEQEQPPK